MNEKSKYSKKSHFLKLVKGLMITFLLLAFLKNVIEPLLSLNRKVDAGLIEAKHRISQAQDYLSYLGKDKTMTVPKKNFKGVDVSTVLLEIQKVALEDDVKIENIRLQDSREINNGSIYQKTPIELDVSGSESSFARFMAGLEQCNFLCRVAHLTIASDPGSEDAIKGLVRLEKIDLIKWRDSDSSFDLRPERPRPYEAKAQLRKLFKSPLVLRPKNVQVALDGLGDVIKDLNLVGIIQDGTRKAVIEDKKTAKTYFLRAADSIGDMKVSEIKEDEVILEAAGGSFTLTL